MPTRDNLGLRMKGYEEVSKTRLMKRTPVAIRLDGKAFHTFARNFEKPFDEILTKSMQQTMKYLCENIQGCVFGYTQSDEITLILVDYKKLNTTPWFDNEIQKMCSISASLATLEFNRAFRQLFHSELFDIDSDKIEVYDTALKNGAMFDSRCFNIPREEVTNLLYWRQLDAIRNSILSVGQANFSHRQLYYKSCSDIKEMLWDKGIVWENLPIYQQRGTCCIKKNGKWILDTEIPIFKGSGRMYIECYLLEEEE